MDPIRPIMLLMDQRTLDYYSKNAGELTQRYESASSQLANRFRSCFSPGGRVLDVGCGSGRDLAELHRQGFDVFDNPYPKLCQDFAQSVEHGSQIMQPEPAYHSRAHFKDVCLALSALASQVSFNGEGEEFDQRWQLSSEDWWILLFCAIAHDYGHPGTRNQTPFELEKYAVDLTHEFLLRSSYPLLKIKSLMADLEPIVLATDPRYLDTLSHKFLNQDHPNSRTDLMELLLVEADLCASALPKR